MDEDRTPRVGTLALSIVEMGAAIDAEGCTLAASTGRALDLWRFTKCKVGMEPTVQPMVEWHQPSRFFVAHFRGYTGDVPSALAVLTACNMLLSRFGPPLRIIVMAEADVEFEDEDGIPEGVAHAVSVLGVARDGSTYQRLQPFTADEDGLVRFDDETPMQNGLPVLPGSSVDRVLVDFMADVRRASN